MQPPEILYKFAAPSGAEAILRTASLFCTRPRDFHDAFDSVHIEEPSDPNELNVIGQSVYFAEVDSSTGLPPASVQEDMKRWAEESVKAYPGFAVALTALVPPGILESPRHFKEGFLSRFDTEDCRALCLAEDATNPLMWDRYALGHRGVAIGLNTTSSVFLSKIAFGSPRKVFYSVEPSRGPREVGLWRKWFVKPELYRYESEWRALFAECSLTSFLDEAGGKREVIHLPEGTIKRVVLGARISESDKQAVLELVPQGVHVVQAELSLSDYSITLTP